MCRAVCRARTPQGHGLRVPLLPAARCSRRDVLPAGPAGHPPAQSSSWKSVRGNTLSSLSLPTAHRRRTVWVTEGRRCRLRHHLQEPSWDGEGAQSLRLPECAFCAGVPRTSRALPCKTRAARSLSQREDVCVDATSPGPSMMEAQIIPAQTGVTRMPPFCGVGGWVWSSSGSPGAVWGLCGALWRVST